MRSRLPLMFASAALALQLTPGAAALAPACPSKTMAFYYGWYGGPPEYRHWRSTDPRFPHDPNQFVAEGPQYADGVRRDIAATDYPALGPYDSHDAALVDMHLTWASSAGIDTLISSWWGPGSHEDAALHLLLDRIEATDSPITASIYLETWALFSGGQFQPDFFTHPGNFAPSSRARIRERAARWLAYLLETYGDRAGLLRVLKRGHEVPVIFVYTVALFEPFEWQSIFRRVRTLTGKDAFYQGDVEGADVEADARVFDGVHLYTPAFLTLGGDLSLAARVLNPKASLRNPASPRTDPITVGTDYRVWATEARAFGKQWAATVIPGFDDRHIRNPSFVVSRDHGHGRTYDYFWRQALESRAQWVLVTSFNEWHEGTEIEPSVEYGSEFIARTRAWTDRIRSCSA